MPPRSRARSRTPRRPAVTPAVVPCYFNRELSWLAFNRRVLEQAQSDRHPLLERVRFLAIFSNNLDEFFEIRVAGLIQQADSGVAEPGPDGLDPHQQLRRIRTVVDALLDEQYRCWHHQLIPALAAEGIRIKSAGDLTARERAWLRAYFRDQVYPVLTPLAIDQAHPFPQLSNKTGLSENIRVRSLVGRFLEHARVFYFENHGSAPTILAGSADWMPRNFLRRVEVLFPIEEPKLRRWVMEELFPIELRDTANTRLLQSNGSYVPAPRHTSGRAFSAHAHLMASATQRART